MAVDAEWIKAYCKERAATLETVSAHQQASIKGGIAELMLLAQKIEEAQQVTVNIVEVTPELTMEKEG